MEPAPARTRRRLLRDEYVEGVLRGDGTILSRAITLIESLHAEDVVTILSNELDRRTP